MRGPPQRKPASCSSSYRTPQQGLWQRSRTELPHGLVRCVSIAPLALHPTPVAKLRNTATIRTDRVYHPFLEQKTGSTRGETNHKKVSSAPTSADSYSADTDSNDRDISRGAGEGSTGGTSTSLSEEALRAHFDARERSLRGEPEVPVDADSSVMAASKLLGVSADSSTDMMNISLRQAAIDEPRPHGEFDTTSSNDQRQAATGRGYNTDGADHYVEGPGDSCSGDDNEHDARSKDAIRKAVSAAISALTLPLDVHNLVRNAH